MIPESKNTQCIYLCFCHPNLITACGTMLMIGTKNPFHPFHIGSGLISGSTVPPVHSMTEERLPAHVWGPFFWRYFPYRKTSALRVFFPCPLFPLKDLRGRKRGEQDNAHSSVIVRQRKSGRKPAPVFLKDR